MRRGEERKVEENGRASQTQQGNATQYMYTM